MRRFLLAFTLALAPLWAAGELSNRRAPGFSLPDLNLKQHDLGDYRGKVVVLEIMLTNCPHCAKFAPLLEEVSRKYGARVQVISIVNPPDTTSTVGRFATDNKVTYPILFDCGQAAGSYMKASPQNPRFDIPHLFLIDQRGMIRNDWAYSVLNIGIFEGRALFAEVEKVLGPPAKKVAPK